MYISFCLSLMLVPFLGGSSAHPMATTHKSLHTQPTSRNITAPDRLFSFQNLNSTYAPKTANYFNGTNQFQKVNAFPDPVVKCSGRSLSDGNTNWLNDLDAAVITTSKSGLYGACDAARKKVDGEGNLAFKSGHVQIYICNYGFTPNPCSVNEYWRADNLINNSCGSNGGGWVYISAWGKTIGRDPTNSNGSFRSECGKNLHGV